MGVNKIEVYEGNDLNVIVTVTGIDSLSGYTSTMTVKRSKSDTTALFTAAGSINGLVITYPVTGAKNSINRGPYYFECVITTGTLNYTIVQDYYQVLESQVYHTTT